MPTKESIPATIAKAAIRCRILEEAFDYRWYIAPFFYAHPATTNIRLSFQKGLSPICIKLAETPLPPPKGESGRVVYQNSSEELPATVETDVL